MPILVYLTAIKTFVITNSPVATFFYVFSNIIEEIIKKHSESWNFPYIFIYKIPRASNGQEIKNAAANWYVRPQQIQACCDSLNANMSILK